MTYGHQKVVTRGAHYPKLLAGHTVCAERVLWTETRTPPRDVAIRMRREGRMWQMSAFCNKRAHMCIHKHPYEYIHIIYGDMVDMYGLFTYVTGVVPLLYTVPISHLGV